MINADDVFNPKDFESIKLIVYFNNYTTQTEIRDPTAIQLTEIGDKYLVLDLPGRTCNNKHSVLVEIFRVDRKSNKEVEVLKATGKVFKMEELEDRSRAIIECLQYDEKSWTELSNLFSSRQAEIEKFFAAVRGY